MNTVGSNLFQAGILSVNLSIPASTLDARNPLGIARAMKVIAICTITRLHNAHTCAIYLKGRNGEV